MQHVAPESLRLSGSYQERSGMRDTADPKKVVNTVKAPAADLMWG